MSANRPVHDTAVAALLKRAAAHPIGDLVDAALLESMKREDKATLLVMPDAMLWQFKHELHHRVGAVDRYRGVRFATTDRLGVPHVMLASGRTIEL